MQDKRIIGVIEPDLVGAFTAAVMDGIHNVAQQHDAQVLVCKGSPFTVGSRELAQAHVGGWILCDTAADIQYLGHPEKPVVAVCMAGCASIIPTIMPDNAGGVQAVMRHLFEHGHERIAFIGWMANADVQQRLASYRAMLEERDLYDPRLVIDAVSCFEEHGRNAVKALLATGLEFTAVVTGGDFNAFGVVEMLRASGLRVPEDVAVSGFDDVPSAQFADPPLTTVYQRPEALGELAAQTLLAMLAGQEVEPGEKFASTALIRRRSCGCDTTQALPLPRPAALRKAGWRTELVRRLVLLARHPLPLDPEVEAAQVWPGAAWLAEQLAAILEGAAVPDTKVIEQAWREATAMTDKLDILHAVVKLLETAGDVRVAALKVNEATRARIATFIDRNRLAMMRAQRSGEEIVTDELDQLQHTYATIDRALLGDQPMSEESFTWMDQTLAEWACLGLWETPKGSTRPRLRIAAVYQRQQQVEIEAGSALPAAAFPPAELLAAGSSTEKPSNIVLLPVDTTANVRPHLETRPWGVLALRLPTAKQIIYDLHGFKLLASRIAAKLEREMLIANLARAKEVAEEANDLKSKFISNMSHELRTPLNAVLNFTQFLDKERYGGLNDRQKDLQTRILSNSNHLLGLINDILDLAKIEAGKMELLPEEVALAPILEGVMATTLGLSKDKGLRLELEVEESLPPVWIDKTRIRQVLLNLLSNAAKFTEQGGITLRALSTGDGFVQVSVQDTGVGIPPEKHRLVFEEFRQVDSELTHIQAGTGLGMPISKRFIELHGGRMWFTSEPGVGSTFFFTVPLDAAQMASAQALEDAAAVLE